MDAKQSKIKILMFPYVAYGHMYPFVELAKNLIKRNFHVYLCSTAAGIASISPLISGIQIECMDFVELSLPSLPGLPEPHKISHSTLPMHLQGLFLKAFDMSSHNFAQILSSLRPDLLIYDFLHPWIPDLASSLGILAVNFVIIGAATVAQGFNLKKGQEEKDDPFGKCMMASNHILLVNSFREFDGKYVDFLSTALQKKVIPVASRVQEVCPTNDLENVEIMQWLDKKDPDSVVLVSFGSQCFLSKEERETIAEGLELSGLNFIWVFRSPEGEEITLEDPFPKGFSEKGFLIKGWSPQAKILAHHSTGGFLSHCGWNSVKESIQSGVPIIAIPMQFEQSLTAKAVEDIGVGLEIRRNKDDKFDAEQIAKKIRQVMVEESGENVRRKAKELGNILRNKGEEDLDELAMELHKICGVTQ